MRTWASLIRPVAGIVALLTQFAPFSIPAGLAAESCPGLTASAPLRAIRTALEPAALQADQASLTFVGHATFLIESPGGVRIATDYNDYVRPSVTPDIATMNRAHTRHYTNVPDPAIKHVLRGWNPAGGPARHDLTFGDVHVRNVPTNIR